ncbi:MAG: VOC family protein [Candidatus Dormibacteraeota bacterium]|nr:VOC family protein [Candidatus Dormibacteraeota bacterium]
MPDPLDALRLPVVPVDPRPEFAAALLRRIEGREETDASATPTVRYFVEDLDAAIEFYSRELDFEEEIHPSPFFAMLYRGDLRLLLSVPGGPAGGHVLADGTVPEPGGWNRIFLQVSDLEDTVAALRRRGARLRNDITTGVGIRQALLLDPSGNLIELFEPLPGYHERPRGGTR